MTGVPEGPGRIGVSICDIGCGMNAHAAVLEALIERGITGLGKAIAVSLFDTAADWMNVPLLYSEGTGRAPARVGLAHPSICPYGTFTTSDGSLVLISIQNEREWAEFCTRFLGQPDLPGRAGFSSNVERVANRSLVDAHIAATFNGLSQSDAAAKLRAANIAFGMVNDVAGLARHPALRRIGIETPCGPAAIVAPAPRMGDADRALGPVPGLGEHTGAIRAEFAT